MSERVQLLEMFSLCRPEGELLRAAQGCQVLSASLDQARRSIHLEVEFAHPVEEELQERLSRLLAQAYDLSQVSLCQPVKELNLTDSWVKERMSQLYPPAIGLLAGAAYRREGNVLTVGLKNGGSQALAPFGRRLAQRIQEELGIQLQVRFQDELGDDEEVFRRAKVLQEKAMAGYAVSAPPGGGSRKPAGEPSRGRAAKTPPPTPAETIYGRPISRTAETVPMGSLNLDMKTVVVEGDVFAVEHRELKKRNAWVISFDVTDYTGSVTVSKFFDKPKEAQPLLEGIKEGQHLRIQGKVSFNRYSNDMELQPYSVQLAPKTGRQDTAEEKRVELHLHTRFSTMDGLTETKDAVKRAIQWGHRAIAITDHGVAQAYPDAAKASGGKIKILYGVEAYYINDVDDRVVVHGSHEQDLDGEIVCFDIETTGLSPRSDVITEIGAVVLKNGEVGERYSTFVNPGRPLARNIVELTGITDEMLADAPSQEEALNDFLDWVGDRPLAAHNAEFDMSFLAEGCRRMGRPFHNTSLDTLILSQNLLPELSKFKLDIVAEHLNLPAFQHHRAYDDAATVAYMLQPFGRMLRDEGVHTLQQINPAMRRLRGKGKTRRQPKHLIVLAKNQSGLRNLYKLISLAHLEHFRRVPIMPKSIIEENREGLILGSACEAGELFQAVIARKDWEELKRIASWYDYLEIQPLCNNYFMLRKGTARDKEELREFNRTVLALGKELGKPVCATGDVHFLDPEDEPYRHILLASKKFDDADESLPIYFKTTDEMLEEFSYLGEEDCRKVVIDDPNFIADQCDVIPPLPKGLFAPKLENSAQELESLVWGKAHELYGEDPPQIVKDRIELELPGIIMRKYDVIYMSAQKLVQNSLEHGYLVGSRGSVGSSIVAFLSGITEVNSLPAHYRCPNCKHSDFEAGKAYGCGADMPDAVCPVCGAQYVKDGFNIPFETFLGFGGTKVPDIDLNFSGEYQAKAHRYTFELFGESHVFRAGTIGTVAEKTAFGYVKKYLEERGKTVTRAEENRLSKGCVGIKRTTGQHPGGMVVIPQDKEIYDFCPVQHPADDPDSDIVTTHFEYHCMEDNLLKLDMLGHDDPTMIRKLQDLTGIDPQKIPLDDKDTMSIFTSSKVYGFEDDPILGPTGACAIPEFGTSFVRGMLEDTHPDKFDILVRLSGFSHGTDVWLGNAKDLITSKTATVGEAIGCRDDIMIYLMSMGVEPLIAFKIMEAVRKGKVKKAGFEPGWEETMREHNVPDWYIESCRKIGYLFPKAHAVAYVMMAFRIAWFKVHQPLAFYSAYFSIRAKAFDATCMCLGLDVCMDKMKEIKGKENPTAVEEDMLVTLEVCYEFYRRGFTFGKMDLYQSKAVDFVIDQEHKALIPPFSSVPGLGESAAYSIVEQREGKRFISVEEFSSSCPKVSKAHIEGLKAMGALDGMPETSQLTLF